VTFTFTQFSYILSLSVNVKSVSVRYLRHFVNVSYTVRMWAGIAQSAYRLATGWTVGGSNPGGGEIFRTCPDRPWGPPSLLCNGYRVFPKGKERPERDTDPSPPSSAVGHERVDLYLYSPLWAVRPVQSLSACTRVTFTFTFFFT